MAEIITANIQQYSIKLWAFLFLIIYFAPKSFEITEFTVSLKALKIGLFLLNNNKFKDNNAPVITIVTHRYSIILWANLISKIFFKLIRNSLNKKPNYQTENFFSAFGNPANALASDPEAPNYKDCWRAPSRGFAHPDTSYQELPFRCRLLIAIKI
jgi:hypothetical protein